MGVSLNRWSGILAIATLISASSSAVMAEELSPDANLLNQRTVPEAFGRNDAENTYFDDESVLGEAEWLFGITYDDVKIQRAGRRVEALYKDYMRQQDEDNPIVRTRDLPNPYETSASQLQTLTNDKGFGFDTQSP